MSIILFLIVLAVLVLVHEFGHFFAAKRLGIRVDEFGLGFSPRIWGKKIGETIYSINLILFGGFVKIFGESPDAESLSGPEASRSFISKPKWAQVVVL
ncbi:MAG: site-2 protease family protein, partial [Candidatus Paceibacterota bacterium]